MPADAQSAATTNSEKANPIRAIHSLRERHVAAIAAAAETLPGDWSIERHEDYEGGLSVLLIPTGDDEAGETFVIYRDGAGIHLGASRWSVYREVGRFGSIEAAMYKITEALALHRFGPLRPIAHRG